MTAATPLPVEHSSPVPSPDYARRKPPGLSTQAERRLRRTAVATVFIIAAAAAILSFNGLRNLALAADIPIGLAWIFPIVVDGLTLVGSLGVVHAVLTGLRAWYPWLLTLAGVGMSVWGNVASSPPELTAQIVHAIPPLVLALSLEALLKVYRYRAVVGGMMENAHTPEEKAAATHAAQHPPLPAETPLWDVLPSAEPTSVSPVNDSSASIEQPAVVTLPASSTPRPQPSPPTGAQSSNASPTTREQLRALLLLEPNISSGEAARRLGKDRSNVGKIMRELRGEAAQ